MDVGEGGPPTAEEAHEPFADLPLAEARELFVTLAKALRAYQLYDENNPVYQRFLSALAEAFQPVWDELDHLHVQVTEDSLLLEGEEVYRSTTRSDSLAFLLFKDGIRDVTFLPGIEGDELPRLLSVLQRARNLRPEGDDLLTVLWEEDLDHFRYHYVDLLAEGVELPSAGSGHTRQELQNVLEAEAPEAGPAVGADADDADRTIRRDDFNPTLYSLDRREMERLEREIHREMGRDLRGDVLAALFDRLEEPRHRDRQSEILGIFRQLLPNFLSRGELDAARDVLAEVRRLEDREDAFDEPRRQQARELVDAISAPDAMEELVQSLEDGSIRPSPRALGAFLSHLRGGALPTLLRAAESTEIRDLRPVMHQAVQGIAGRNPRALADLLRHADPVVVAGAARLAGMMRLVEAGPVLAELMFHEEPSVRVAAVEAAMDMRASTAAGALVDALYDEVREVRIAAAKALGRLQYGPAASEFAEIVTGKDIRAADLSEKIVFFESYGMVAGVGAVKALDRLLNGRGFLGRREPSEVRACAALGLGRIDDDRAHAALAKASDEEDPVVRSAVSRALKGERGS